MNRHEPPKLRLLNIRPLEHENMFYFELSDPQQLSDRVLLVPQGIAMVLAFCDGRRTIAEMCAAFYRNYQVPSEVERVEELFVALDQALMLDNARTQEAKATAIELFRRAPFRRSLHAGSAYPADKRKLWQLLQTYLEQADVDEAVIDWSKPVGLLSPHIDYGRGGDVYAQVWKRAAQAAREAELVILLGTDHFGDDPFTLTRQSYATPYGVLPTAQAIVDQLVEVLDDAAAFNGELRHQTEHSLDLVATWLHHMRGGDAVEMIPMLVGGIKYESEPSANGKVTAVVDVLQAACARRRTLIVASGDLAHVGPAFGGAPLSARGKLEIKAEDYQLLKHVLQGDAAGFFGCVQKIENRNNVCGVAPLYLTMQILAGRRGEQWGYAICPADDEQTSIVTVAGVFFG